MDCIEAKKSLSFSVFLHLGVFTLWIALAKLGPFPSLFPEEKKTATTWIEVVPNLGDQRNDARIVETQKTKKSEKAAKDALLGEQTQIVDLQRVNESPRLGETAQAKAKSKKSSPAQEASANPTSQRSSTIPILSQLGVKMNLPHTNSNPPQIEKVVAEEGALNAQAGGEYVKGFKTGDQTLLNTKEYVFYGYFQRIRKSLDRAWDRSLKNQMDKYFRRGRQLASETDYVTQLMVTLNNDGQIVRIQVIGQSGTQDLDDASVKAFNTAGPFPNPPKGLVDQSGQIKIRWDFVVKT
jgi:TonB family protein